MPSSRWTPPLASVALLATSAALAADALAPSPAATPGAGASLAESGLRRASIRVHGPLESTLVGAVGKEVGRALTQVVTRALVWWVAVPGDLVRGDRLDVLFEERPAAEPVIHAVRFQSQKTGRTHRAYRFNAPGDAFARYFQPTGEELELRLKDAPLDDYEQVTSLIKDGRRHKGVDFKAPVGTSVRATFDGTLTRKTWHFRRNGNSLEVSESGGARTALFLHLSPLSKSLQVGTRVTRGQVIAHSGNTGRSYAPHLHYQLMAADGRVLDPFQSHATYRKSLKPEQKPALDAEIRRMDRLLGAPVAEY